MVSYLEDLPNDIKKNFENLTMVEEMLISPILAVMSVYRLRGGALFQKVFCANFAQDITEITKILPRLPKDLPIIILKKKDQQNKTHQFKINRLRVQSCLTYLCQNNPAYIAHGIQIADNQLKSLPEDGFPEDLFEIEDTNINIDKILVDVGPEVLENGEHDNYEEDDYDAFVETDDNDTLQCDQIRNAINYPKANNLLINEFQNDGILLA